MVVERLHFGTKQMTYHALTASEHLARYAFAARHCRGRRVLDLACGEGYGSLLLAKAGAAHVVGIDVSGEAIRLASERFAADNVTFIEARAEDLPVRLADEAPFDLVVSFETIEHVQDVSIFLQSIRRLAAPNGIIMISCPREPAFPGQPSTNPFHLHTFDIETFQAETTHVLGAEATWFLGTPSHGTAIVEAGSPLLNTGSTTLDEMLRGRAAEGAWLLPAQHEVRVNTTNCSFFLGVWGTKASDQVAVAPLSVPGLQEPWQALEWLKKENARLLRELVAARPPVSDDKIDGEHQRLLANIADLRRAELLDRQRLEKAESETLHLQTELARRNREMEKLQAEADDIRRELEWLRTIEGSRSWRLAQAAHRFYARPVLGLPLRMARRTLRHLRRIAMRS